jgi:hypothetical protein
MRILGISAYYHDAAAALVAYHLYKGEERNRSTAASTPCRAAISGPNSRTTRSQAACARLAPSSNGDFAAQSIESSILMGSGGKIIKEGLLLACPSHTLDQVLTVAPRSQ